MNRTARQTRTTLTTRLLAVPTAVALLALSGCGGSEEPEQQLSSTEHNDADVTFASEMLQHHAQALSMVDLTLGRPLDPEVEELADDIREAQAPEIETFTDWLVDWDEPVPETMRDHANAGHGGEVDYDDSMEGMAEMPGMMSPDDMQALADAPDDEFQDLWLEMMVEHHEGAIDMAETESDEGQYEDAVDLADSIAETQGDEVDRMEALLG